MLDSAFKKYTCTAQKMLSLREKLSYSLDSEEGKSDMKRVLASETSLLFRNIVTPSTLLDTVGAKAAWQLTTVCDASS